MHIKISNGVAALTFYFPPEFAKRYGTALAIKLEGNHFTVRPGTDAKEGEKKCNLSVRMVKGEIDYYYTSLPTPDGLRKFGQTEFWLSDANRLLSTNLGAPHQGTYAPPRAHNPRSNNEETPANPVVVVDASAIREAVALINSLDRDTYRVLLETTTNRVSVRREEVFE